MSFKFIRFVLSLPSLYRSFLITVATSTSFYGVVGLQNFIATAGTGDIGGLRVLNVFTTSDLTASVKDRIYLLDAQITIGPIIDADDEGKSVYFFHLFVNNDLQSPPDGTHACPMFIIAGKVSRSTFSIKQENVFDIDLNMLPGHNGMCEFTLSS
ncbi:hypothetical protein BDR07DRAFT_1371559 [Suillus spraguei]|nr:hypothetical protein BDR07DRAFT_1371559 [Suillus spraguei]